MEQQSLRRSRLKIAVSCILGVSIVCLVGMLIQGCKREQPTDSGMTPPDLSSNSASMDASNTPPDLSSNVAMIPPPMTNTPPPVIIPPPPVEQPVAAGTEYIVVAGDTLGKIAKHNHVTLKDLEAANPGVDSKHLKVKQKLTIPASTATASTAAAPGSVTPDAGSDLYTIKSGDTLARIARAHHTTVKAIQAANNLATTQIKVGKKLKLPAAADAAPAAPAPMVDTTPAPAVTAPVMTPPVQSTAPAR